MTNNQIRRVATETDVWCDQNWSGHEFYDVRWEEKFAELIVKECSSIVQNFVDHRIPASEYPEKIKQHFEIE